MDSGLNDVGAERAVAVLASAQVLGCSCDSYSGGAVEATVHRDLQLTLYEVVLFGCTFVVRVDFEGGMSMVRLVLREGTRITQVDLDAATATSLGEALVGAARDL